MKKVVEISFDYANRDFMFPPLSRPIRGRFLLSRVAEPSAMSYRGQIPEDVPGQILGLDPEKGVGFLVEPIHQRENIKAQLTKKDFRFEPERQEFPNVEVDAWCYWMRRLIDDNKAILLKGELPTLDEINYTPPNRLAPRPRRGPARLREIFQSDPSVAAQYMAWDQAKRSQWEQLVGV